MSWHNIMFSNNKCLVFDAFEFGNRIVQKLKFQKKSWQPSFTPPPGTWLQKKNWFELAKMSLPNMQKEFWGYLIWFFFQVQKNVGPLVKNAENWSRRSLS